MARPTRITDPTQLPVQLNVDVPFEFREHLYAIAEDQGVPVTHLVRNTLLAAFPLHKG